MADVLKSAVIASMWWAQKVRDTANIANYDTGGRDFAALLNALNATSLAPTPEAVETFQIALQQIIMRELINNPETKVTLSCKNSPDSLLSRAAELAGIDTSVFPLQRTMMVSMDRVFVSDGNGKPFLEVQSA